RRREGDPLVRQTPLRRTSCPRDRSLTRSESMSRPNPFSTSPAAGTPLVKLQGITKDYQRGGETVHVLQTLDLDIPRGDFLALMGPSGSGKTTLLNLLGGIDRPSGGSLAVDGTDIARYSESDLARWRARNVGFVFQLYHLLPVLSAERNVELPLLLTGLSASERKLRVQAALQLANIADRAKHKPSELSGGQEQRVGIARAIVGDPLL